ncbi:MAG: type II toxin-antitoxin system Phd/YefM family antitoxin [Syntrophomonadaceae bacterium]|nr:type II toxin-antitoxin system Phd/YefM family antitoxin [Syntrophomonadaceae bacterium]
MEKIIGIDKIRPLLGKYLEEIEQNNDVVVISSRSKPKGVLISYSSYEELKKLSEKAKQLEVKSILDEMREQGEKSSLTEKDVQTEIKEVRHASRN